MLAVSEDERITEYEEREAARCHQVAEAGREASMILADKTSKPSEPRLETTRTRHGPTQCPAPRTPD